MFAKRWLLHEVEYRLSIFHTLYLGFSKCGLKTLWSSQDPFRKLVESKSCIHKFKMQDGPMDFNITKYKMFINMVSASTLKLIFRKLPLVSFGVVAQKNVFSYLKILLKYSSFFQLHICMRSNFLHIFSPK